MSARNCEAPVSASCTGVANCAAPVAAVSRWTRVPLPSIDATHTKPSLATVTCAGTLPAAAEVTVVHRIAPLGDTAEHWTAPAVVAYAT